MKKNHTLKGQEAIEFILITVLVFFGALTVVMVFGNKIANFFQNDSSVVQAANTGVNTISASDTQKFQPDYDTVANVPVGEVESVGGYDVTVFPDGSARALIDGSEVDFSADYMTLANTVFETSGSGGLQEVIAELANMIAAAKATDSTGATAVEVLFGSGERTYDNMTYYGDAIVNTTTLKVGNQVTIIQQDQGCKGNDTQELSACTLEGKYIIKGKIDGDQFTANVTNDGINHNPHGDYTASVDMSNGFALNNGKFNMMADGNSKAYTYDWNINSDADKSFAISY